MKKENLYNYERQYKRNLERLDSSKKISESNKETIKQYDRDSKLKGGIELPTILKYYDILVSILLNYLNKDFRKFTKSDFEKVVEKINARDDITITTKQKYWAVIKKFGNWLVNGDKVFNGMRHDYPETVAWINTTIKSKNMSKIKAGDILTEQEVDKLISSTESVRDKAFLSILYETGSRISEIGNVRNGDITEQEHGYLIDLAPGKTGERNVIVVFSSSKFSAWLNQHPDKNNKNAPLWVAVYENNNNKKQRGQKLDYRSLYKIVERAKNKSGIKKRIHPHIFRHSRVTHLLINKQLNEQQAKVYFGWSPSSKQLATYSHLASSDVNNTMLEINGLKPVETEVGGKKAKLCPNCRKPNDPKDSFCGFCSKPMDFKTFMRQQEREDVAKKGYGTALKEKGKIDDTIVKDVIREMIKSGEIKI